MSRAFVGLGVPALIAATFPAPALAQTDRPSAAPHVGIAVGVDADLYGRGRSTLGYYAQGGLEWRQRAGGLGLRADLVYFQRSENYPGRGYCFTACTRSSRLDQLGIAASATYAFLRRLPVRPYLLTGVGLYGARTRQSLSVPVAGCGPFDVCDTRPLGTATGRAYGLGVHAGGGLALDVGRVHLFTETRYHLIDWGSPGLYGGLRQPILVGLRF
jgi:hypothetical protein